MKLTPDKIAKEIATGNWKPNMYLTNMSIAYLQKPENVAKGLRLFPRVPVATATGHYYKYDKATLARDDVKRKPAFGKVEPSIMGNEEDTYTCKVDQIIMGIDQITALNYQRAGVAGTIDPRKSKTIAATEKMNTHLDVMFSKAFFKAGVWQNELEGVTTTPTAKQFYQFDNDNADPIQLFDSLCVQIQREGRRKPNKLALGVDTFTALKSNPMILERVKFGGSTLNPATVNERALAELFGLNEVVVLDSSYNTAPLGAAPNMEFICDAKGALLLYAPDTPHIDEPSAGYTFSWDALGNGQPVVFSHFLGESGTHSEFIEGICAYDMKKTGDDMAVYLKNCVSEESE